MDFSSSDNSGHMTTKVPFKIEVVNENVFPSKTLYPKIKWEGMGRGKSKAKGRLKSMCPKAIHPKPFHLKGKSKVKSKTKDKVKVKVKVQKEAKVEVNKESKMSYNDILEEDLDIFQEDIFGEDSD